MRAILIILSLSLFFTNQSFAAGRSRTKVASAKKADDSCDMTSKANKAALKSFFGNVKSWGQVNSTNDLSLVDNPVALKLNYSSPLKTQVYFEGKPNYLLKICIVNKGRVDITANKDGQVHKLQITRERNGVIKVSAGFLTVGYFASKSSTSDVIQYAEETYISDESTVAL